MNARGTAYFFPKRFGLLTLLLAAGWSCGSSASGQGTDFSFSRIERLATEQQDPGAPGILSLYYRYGYGVPQNLFTAASVISPEAAGHPFSQYNMGVLMLNRAATLADSGAAERLRQQAEVLFRQSVPGLTELSERGDPLAQLLLGGCYETGRGVPRDAERAFELYHASSTAGLPLAWSNLADLLLKGRGTPKDLPNGIALMEKAAGAGVPMAKYSLAQAYLTGEGKPKSIERGFALLHEAADQHNHQIAQADLARFYLDGVHVRKNEELGLTYLRQAAVNNSPAAVERARRMGYEIHVSAEFPESFNLALSGRARVPVLQPLILGTALASASASRATPAATAMTPPPTPKPLPPGFAEFQPKFAEKAGQVFRQMQAAILANVQAGEFSASAVFQQLHPSTGKAAEWLESSFASENLLLREHPDWSEPLLPDKTFAYAVVDLPAEILPLLQTGRNSEALAALRARDQSQAGLSPPMIQAWRDSLAGLETYLSGQILASEELRRQSADALAKGQTEAAVNTFRQAMQKDLRSTDAGHLDTLETEIKRRAFEDTGL
jgi:TPR repeat protein